MCANFVSNTVLSESGVQFGTSGARGLVTDFTLDVCAAFTHAFINVMQTNFDFTVLALAIDNRPSSYTMAMACAAAAQQANIKVVYYGVIPTPALAYIAMQQGIPSMMITGSHIPFDRNGLKFYRPDGEISKQDEQAILGVAVPYNALTELARLDVNAEAANQYIARYTELFNDSPLSGKRIGIYEHSSAGRELYEKIFTALGAEVIALERTDTFVPIDTEAVSEEDRAKAITWSAEYNLDAIFSTDGDGDRPLLADENGEWLRGDILGLLCAAALDVDALAVPVSCNTSIELSGHFDCVTRTKIGSPYVIAEFSELTQNFKNVAGFEANGGFLLGSDIVVNGQLLKKLPTRDAVLPAIIVLCAATKGSISELVNALPQRVTASDRIKNFATQRSLAIIDEGIKNPTQLLDLLGMKEQSLAKLDTTDGLRLTLGNGDIIHLRPSGNAPELRCYAEAATESTATNYVEVVLQRVQAL